MHNITLSFTRRAGSSRPTHACDLQDRTPWPTASMYTVVRYKNLLIDRLFTDQRTLGNAKGPCRYRPRVRQPLPEPVRLEAIPLFMPIPALPPTETPELGNMVWSAALPAAALE